MSVAPLNIQMAPESGKEIQQQIKDAVLGPIKQGAQYQSLLGQKPGVNIGPDIPKLLLGLGRFLGLADPSGMVGGPAGFVYHTYPSTSPKLLEMLPEIKKIGETAEELAPRAAAVTKKMPVALMKPEFRPGIIGDYIPPTIADPLGNIGVYKPDPTVVLHEGIGHGLPSLDTEVQTILNELYDLAPTGTNEALKSAGVSSSILREDFGARLIEDVMAERVGEVLGMKLPTSGLPFTPEAKSRIWNVLKEPAPTPAQVSGKEALKKMGITKAKAPKTSEILKDLYTDMHGLAAENHPTRSMIEASPFKRVQFHRELLNRAEKLPNGPHKTKAVEVLKKIDPKDPKAAYDIEFAAELIHEGIGNQIARTEALLHTEFGDDAKNIIYKLWNDVLNPTEEGKILEKRLTRAEIRALKEEGKSKEIQKVMRQEIGRDIQKSSGGGTITSKKGGGMISKKTDKLSEMLEETPRPADWNELGRLWTF